MPQVNPKRTLYAINNDAGAFTVIRLTTWAKYLAIYEDASQNAGAAQGLQYRALDPFAQSADIDENSQPAAPNYFIAPASTDPSKPEVEFGDKFWRNGETTAPLGNPGSDGNVDSPGGQVTLGTPIVEIRTNSANATNVIVEEWA